MISKYKTIKRLIEENIKNEIENYEEARRVAGSNCCGACMADGAIQAYKQVLKDLEELELVASIVD